MAQLGVANTVASEFQLMTNKVDALKSRAAEIDESQLDALGLIVKEETGNLLKLTKNIGQLAQAQTSYLARMNRELEAKDRRGSPIQASESTANILIEAAGKTSEAAHMLYLLASSPKMNDKDTKYLIQAACGEMRKAMVSLRVNLDVKGGSQEILQRIETLHKEVLAGLDRILQASARHLSSEPAPHPEVKSPDTQFNLLIQRSRAAEVLRQRERDLAEAQEAVKRLNRASARRRQR
jgi:hypothetical protein